MNLRYFKTTFPIILLCHTLIAMADDAATKSFKTPSSQGAYQLLTQGIFSTAAVTGNRFLILLNPAIPISLTAEDLDRTSSIASRLVDSLPPVAWSWAYDADLADSLPKKLQQIVDQIELTKESQSSPSALSSTDAALLFKDSAQKQPTDDYTKYLALTKERDNAKKALADKSLTKQARSDTALNLDAITNKIEQIPQEEKIATAAENFQTAIATATSELSIDQLNNDIASYQGPTFTPRVAEWNSPSGWAKSPVGPFPTGSPSKAFKLPPTASKGSWLPDRFNALASEKLRHLSFEYKQIGINRNSLPTQFLDSSSWRLKTSTTEISNGLSPSSGEALAGQLPLVIDSLLICRNIHLDLPITGDIRQEYLNQTKTGSFVYFPFVLQGNYFSDNQGRFVSAVGSQGFFCPELEILAIVCRVVPKSPKPQSK